MTNERRKELFDAMAEDIYAHLAESEQKSEREIKGYFLDCLGFTEDEYAQEIGL